MPTSPLPPAKCADTLRAANLGTVDEALDGGLSSTPGDFDGRSDTSPGPRRTLRDADHARDAAAALRAARSRRPAPGRDDKVVLEWNAMLATALVETNDPRS